MNPAEFLSALEGRRIIERAAKAAAMPVSVHAVEKGAETDRLFGVGQCAACQRACSQAAGREACAESRGPAAVRAVRRSRPVPFVCYLGFACVSIGALPGASYVLTFGPYSPMPEMDELEVEVSEGLEALNIPPLHDPGALISDVRVVPSEAVLELAQWTAGSLGERAAASASSGDTRLAMQEEVPEEPPAVSLTCRAEAAPFDPAPVALALAANQGARAKNLLQSALEEGRGGRKSHAEAALQARAVALAGAVIEAAARAGMDPTGAWAAFPGFLEALREIGAPARGAEAVMAVLTPLRKKSVRQAARSDALDGFHRVVLPRLAEALRLEDVAAELGEHPTAITHRLQRAFGLSYSEYMARLRVGEAKSLLRETELRVGEIARRVGIGDSSNFGRVFRGVEGISPSEYRRRFGRR